jgi:RNA polymerase sigma factor (sigma-70 family)
MNNSGTEQDGFDVFQESLLAILQIISDKDWKTDLPFGAYFFRVCRNKWIDQLRKKNKEQEVRTTELHRYKEKQYDNLFEYENQEDEIKFKLMMVDTFKQLSPLCQKLIPLTQSNTPTNEIADTLEMPSANTVYRRKFACYDTWKKLLMKHKYFPLWESRNKQK